MNRCHFPQFPRINFTLTPLGPPQWTGKSAGAHHGLLTADPAGAVTTVLTFTQTNSAGDIFTSDTAFAAGTYWLSFDYFGDTTKYSPPNHDTGGYVGISQDLPGIHSWFYATGTASGASDVLLDDNVWHSYVFSISSPTAFHLMIEDFSGSGGGAGDAFFDNIVLRDTSPVPEPATMLLFGTGIGGFVTTRKRRRK